MSLCEDNDNDNDNDTNSIISISSKNSNNSIISISSTSSNNINSISSNNSCNISIKSHDFVDYNDCCDNTNTEYNHVFFTHNNNNIHVSSEELNIFENDCINIAILSNYYDKKDDSQFSKLYLPEISMTYNSLEKIFFNSTGKSFSPFILNKIWNSIKGLNLVNEYLKIFEKKTEISRNELSIVSKIKLYKECSFSSITSKASKLFALNLNELNSILISGQYREDEKNYVSINFLLYSEILQIGINIILPILLTNIQNSLCVVNNNETILLDF